MRGTPAKLAISPPEKLIRPMHFHASAQEIWSETPVLLTVFAAVAWYNLAV